MITLPDDYVPRSATPAFLDAGFVQRGARGLPVGKVNVPGSRFALEVLFPSMTYARASALVALLQAGVREGLRMKWPLMATTQPGGTGAVNVAASGTSLPVRGLTPAALIARGSWVTVIDAAGARCLHQVLNDATVAGGGTVTLTVQPPLRTVLADGNQVLVSVPVIEGVITGQIGWELPVNRIVPPIGFKLEEVEA